MANNLATKPAAKICESCGTEFGCGAKLDGCWCTEIMLTDAQADDIKAKFNDCLCPACIEKLAAKASMKLT